MAPYNSNEKGFHLKIDVDYNEMSSFFWQNIKHVVDVVFFLVTEEVFLLLLHFNTIHFFYLPRNMNIQVQLFNPTRSSMLT